MNRIGAILLVAGALLYAVSELDRRSELALWIVELDSGLPLPSWMLALIGGSVIKFLGRGRVPRSKSFAIEPQPENTSPVHAPRPLQDLDSSSKRMELREAADGLDLPRGASIVIDKVKNVPFTLRLERTTPEASRRSMDIFAAFLAGVPTPRRASVSYVDVMESGVPKQNQVMGALRKYIPAGAVNVTSQLESVDITFASPDSFWEKNANLLRTFI